jgi:D-alanyl-D-alanine carboxypeptidase (penicillin-binding protein 5/6)
MGLRKREERAWVASVALAAAVLIPHETTALTGPPNVTAKAALLMDAGTGAVLWARSPDEELPPASTTKVMTAILALESGKRHRVFEASPEACAVAPRKLKLRPGQRLSLENLTYAILLNSANDASAVIAEGLAGSVPAFAEQMTARARSLGALHTRFANPHGLTAEGHYSSVHDLATIFRHALTVPGFRDIIGTKAVTIGIENSNQRITLRSHNRLLNSRRIPVIGKTGYTVPAKKCFVGAGTYNGREIIVAVLGSNDLWGDTTRLLHFGFGDSSPAAPLLQQARRGSRSRTKSAHGRGRRTSRAQRYAIRVGTFDRIAQAKRLQHALKQRGYDPIIGRVASGRGRNKRTRYHVQIGTYPNQNQAKSALRAVVAKVALPAQIVQR